MRMLRQCRAYSKQNVLCPDDSTIFRILHLSVNIRKLFKPRSLLFGE